MVLHEQPFFGSRRVNESGIRVTLEQLRIMLASEGSRDARATKSTLRMQRCREVRKRIMGLEVWSWSLSNRPIWDKTSEGNEFFGNCGLLSTLLLEVDESRLRKWIKCAPLTLSSLSSMSQEFKNCRINSWVVEEFKTCSLVWSTCETMQEWISFRLWASEKKNHRVLLDFTFMETQTSGISNWKVSMLVYGTTRPTSRFSVSSSKLLTGSSDLVWKTTSELSVATKQDGRWLKPSPTLMHRDQPTIFTWSTADSFFTSSGIFSWMVDKEEQPMISLVSSSVISKYPSPDWGLPWFVPSRDVVLQGIGVDSSLLACLMWAESWLVNSWLVVV